MKAVRFIGSIEQERVGPIWIALSESGLVGVHMQADESWIRRQYEGHDVLVDNARVDNIRSQLKAYFEGVRNQFDVTIDWEGLGTFQQHVLQQVLQIPYGQTRTYQEIAATIGEPGAARAVGRANATNPMPIIIPCHRVLGADGRLHGYSGPGGVETKAWLLQIEGSRLL